MKTTQQLNHKTQRRHKLLQEKKGKNTSSIYNNLHTNKHPKQKNAKGVHSNNSNYQ